MSGAHTTDAGGAGAQGAPATGDLVEQARQFLAAHPSRVVRDFLPDWPVSRARCAGQPAALPAIRWLDEAGGRCDAAAGALLRLLAERARALTWCQTYTSADLGAEFMDNYAWTEIVGPRGLAASRQLACGILVLGPHIHYPSHHHEAYEVYVPLSGVARWQQGERDWLERAPGDVIEHASDVPHAMQTAAAPLVALYLWRSANLAQRARLGAP